MSADPEAPVPLLSIVTVCRNSARTIGETIRSVDLVLAGQDEVEHLVVDGLSTDSTLDLVEAQPMRRLVSEADTGLYDAMNKGLRLVRGEYVWFLNSDDYLHPNLPTRWRSLLDLLRNRRAPVVIGEVQMFKETPSGAVPTRYWRAPRKPEQARRLGWHPPHPAFIARRRLLLDLGGFDESKRIAADFKLMTQAMAAVGKEAVTFPHALVAMREGGVSNGSVAAILRANRECYASLRELGASPPSAGIGVFAKLLRKVGQKLSPARMLAAKATPAQPVGEPGRQA